ncbi:MAG TPA: AI-2E family transporter [Anaerolineales bacterium]|nr:AI-2E family transporter [Anaerolineales bacterium]
MSRVQADSPRWGSTTKALVGLLAASLIVALLIRFRSVVYLLIVAGIVAFLVHPVVRTLNRKARLKWPIATNLTFLFIFMLVLTVSTATGLAAVQQLQALFFTLEELLFDLPALLEELGGNVVAIGPWSFDLSTFDLSSLASRALDVLQPTLGRTSSLVAGLASVAFESVARFLFVLVVAYFLTLDHARIRERWSGISIPRYEHDLGRLRTALTRIWDSFLRGQLLVVACFGAATAVMLTGLGVRFSIALGILGGAAKFVPILGPTMAGVAAALVALFQPTNWFGATPLAHAFLVVASVVVLDQSLDYLLVPRIMGTSLNLHPVLIIVGAIVGASLAGVLGLLLSAPAMATMLLLGRYIFRKLTDQSPWDPPIDARPQPRLPLFGRFWERWARKKRGQDEAPKASSEESGRETWSAKDDLDAGGPPAANA